MARILHVLGRWLLIFALLHIPPMIVSAAYQDGALIHFLMSALITLSCAVCIVQMTRHTRLELKSRDGFLLLVLAWVASAILGSVPLALNLRGLSVTDAVFESMAGVTTTGATVLTHLDALPHSINFWRHELQWIGGLASILLAVAVLPTLGIGGRQWYRAETLGPLKGAQVVPRLIQATRMFLGLYVALTCACALALSLAGMQPFDALAHALSTVSLGGFSTHDRNIAYFGSPAIEFVLMSFMTLASLNFVTHFLALRRFTLRPYREDKEVAGTLLLIATSILGLALYLVNESISRNVGEALGEVAFNVVSIATTCGFFTSDYSNWPTFACFWILFLSCLTAASGSPGGGIKMFRSLILLRQSLREMRTLVHPSAVTPLRVGGRALSPAIVQSVLAFIFIYFVTAAAFLFLLLLTGLDLQTSVSAIVSCLNSTGPGLGDIGPGHTYAALSNLQKWVCFFAMLAGRIEIFALIVVFTPAFWRK